MALLTRANARYHWYGESAQGTRLPRGPEAVERADAVLANFFARTCADDECGALVSEELSLSPSVPVSSNESEAAE